MSANSDTAALGEWFRESGGRLHPNLSIVYDELSGYHLKATGRIEPSSSIISVPHSVTMSYMNALVDKAIPVFRQDWRRFKVESMGFFYLMFQYVDRQESFWKPYLDTLPGPEADFLQPLWFENEADIAWLEGTDVWHTVTARRNVYKQYYRDGIQVLQEAGLDVKPYTWQLFKWAVTVSSSRSFSSRFIRPNDGVAWMTYQSTASQDGRQRAPAVLDMSQASDEDLNFPVLFPGLDVANHKSDARVEFHIGPSVFTVTTYDAYAAGEEVFINYGPKGNDELLLGYGFCLPNNPYDRVWLTLKEPPLELKLQLKEARPHYFNSDGTWNSEHSTYHIKRFIAHRDDNLEVFRNLPGLMIELLLCILRQERGLPFTTFAQPLEELASPYQENARFLPHIARMLVQPLMQKASHLKATRLPNPTIAKQNHAALYRLGQLDILESNTEALRTYTRGLVWKPSAGNSTIPSGLSLVRLEDFLLTSEVGKLVDSVFLKGIETSANTQDLKQLRQAGWEEDIWVLLLCYMALQGASGDAAVARRQIFPAYPGLEDVTTVTANASAGDASGMMDIVRHAAAAYPASLWASPTWSVSFINNIGGRTMALESFVIMCPLQDANDECEEPRLCLCVVIGA